MNPITRKISRTKTIEEAIETNLDYLVKFAFFRTGNRQTAEDIVQDAALKLLERNSIAIKPESLRLYLFKTVYNLCCDNSRQTNREVDIGTIDLCDPYPEDVEAQKEADRINTLLENIPETESEIIRMRFVDNLSFAEISEITGTPPTTAKSRFSSGMKKLRTLYLKSHSHE